MEDRSKEYAYILTFTGKEREKSRKKERDYDHPFSETIINDEVFWCL